MSFTRERLNLGLVVLFGLATRLLFWHIRPASSLTWDEASHSLGGLMLAKYFLAGFPPDYIANAIAHYWAVIGSMFFYPYGYTVLSAISFSIFGFNELAARLPAMLSSVLIIIAVYFLGQKLFSKKIGLLAAMMAAMNPWFIFWGGLALVDLPMTCLMLLAVYFCLQGLDSNRTSHWIASGLCVGLAGLMKPPGFVIFPFLILLILLRKNFEFIFSKQFLKFTLIPLICAGSYFGFGLAALFILPKVNIISSELGQRIFSDIFMWLSNPAPTVATIIKPSTLSAWWYYVGLIPRQMGGCLAMIFCLIALWQRRYRTDLYVVLIYILWIYLIFTFVNCKNERYTIPFLPFFCLLAAVGIDAVVNAMNVNYRFYAQWTIIIALVIGSAGVLIRHTDFDSSYFDFNGAAEAINRSGPGLVIIEKEDNSLNVSTASFYLMAHDPMLRNSVYWQDKISHGDYIMTNGSRTAPSVGTTVIFDTQQVRVLKIQKPSNGL